MGQYNWQTCSKVIKAEINTLQLELENILHDNLLGLYLYGSLAQGGFNPERSDINVMAVVQQSLTLALRRSIVELLMRISKAPCPLDVSILAQQGELPLQPPFSYDFHYDEKMREFYLRAIRHDDVLRQDAPIEQDSNILISVADLRQNGVCLYGKPVAEVFPALPEHELQVSWHVCLQNALARRLQDPVGCVLNACRAAAYFQNGEILSKEQSGVWGLAHLPEQYRALIHQSLALYRGERPGRPVGRSVLNDFADYIRERPA